MSQKKRQSPRDSGFTVKVLTLFPEMFPGCLGFSLAGQALEQGLWSIEATDIRDFGSGKHRQVDDAPFGGGAGMVLRPDVLDQAILSVTDKNDPLPLVYLTPRGKPLTQERVKSLVTGKGLVVLCGRFEGVDQRVLEAHNAEEICIGDYVLSGGEPAALVLLDACIRLLPGVMGKAESAEDESFESGMLEYPHYTRPATWQGRDVPEVLLSGHHGNVDAWRKEQAEAITRERRPDLWEALSKDKEAED